MTVSQVASVAAYINRALGGSSTKAAQGIASLLAPRGDTKPAVESAALANAALLQSQVSSLRVASQNIVQAQSLLAAADKGAAQIEEALNRMQKLAVRASDSSLAQAERDAANAEFQQLRQEINKTAGNTRFNGKPLLDGSLSASALGDPGEAVIGGFSDGELFGSKSLVLDSSRAADTAEAAVEAARQYVITQRNAIAELYKGLDVAAATVATASQNFEASRSAFGEEDVLSGGVPVQARIQSQAVDALFAQTNKLPNNVLQLLSE